MRSKSFLFESFQTTHRSFTKCFNSCNIVKSVKGGKLFITFQSFIHFHDTFVLVNWTVYFKNILSFDVFALIDWLFSHLKGIQIQNFINISKKNTRTFSEFFIHPSSNEFIDKYLNNVYKLRIYAKLHTCSWVKYISNFAMLKLSFYSLAHASERSRIFSSHFKEMKIWEIWKSQCRSHLHASFELYGIFLIIL